MTPANPTELNAFRAQLAYLDRAIQNPAAFNLNAVGITQVQYYRDEVQSIFNVLHLGMRGIPLGPRPPDIPGTIMPPGA